MSDLTNSGPSLSRGATEQVGSLWGKIDPKEFGTRIEREKPPTSKKQEPKFFFTKSKFQTTKSEEFDDISILRYHPKTKETQAAYGLLLILVQSVLSDQPRDVLRSATDEVICILLGQDTLKDSEKKQLLEKTLGPFSHETFSQFVSLAKKLVDFVATGAEDDSPSGVYAENGISIVFEDDEDDQDQEDEEESEEPQYTDQVEDAMVEEGQATEEPLNLREVDFIWLQKKIEAHYADPVTSYALAQKAFEILLNTRDSRECENDLVLLFEFDRFDLIKLLVKNQFELANAIRLAQAVSQSERDQLKAHLSESEDGLKLLRRLSEDQPTFGSSFTTSIGSQISAAELNEIDLENVSFSQGNHYMSNRKCILPEKSTKLLKPGYEEIHIPAPPPEPLQLGERLVPIEELPNWARPVFAGTTTLNRVQSRCFDTVFKDDCNVLVCAPTGSGKTNVAVLAILRVIAEYQEAMNTFKIVYVAPMKALVQEIAGSLAQKLSPLNIAVAELSGDSQLSRKKLEETHIIISTPEKWDIVTRRASEREFLQSLRLVIIDEVHLLHDERGPVLESIVVRALRTSEKTQQPIRLLALSATLPNAVDVARFLRVPLDRGLFTFSSAFRPCPLVQQYIGITEGKALKRFHISNQILYEKIIERAGKHQILVFVHSRRETVNVATIIKDMAINTGSIGSFFRQADSISTREILHSEASNVKNTQLKELLPIGFGIHHAGLTKEDRKTVEDLFADGHLQVLFSTATLAWGVNLPAHTVIVKGTQVYSPEQGRWVELSPQDILQMLGRAGRPQFDLRGEGIVITGNSEMQFYLSLINSQLPIESQMIKKLVDCLNAEIVLGGISTREDAIEWLGYSYLYIRMMREPKIYGVNTTDDDALRKYRANLVHTACLLLEKSRMISYDRRSGIIRGTDFGRIASFHYLTHGTVKFFLRSLKPSQSECDILRIFSGAEEFSLIPIREEERLELQQLYERVPFPIAEAIDQPVAKINVLLQAYISRLNLESFALGADLVYITQSASRLLSAIFEISLSKEWANLAMITLELKKMLLHRQWSSMTPLRQFSSFPQELIRNLERRDFPWNRMFDLNAQELGELVRSPKHGSLLHRFVHAFPRISIEARILPLSRGILRCDLTLSPSFSYDFEILVSDWEEFWIFVQDTDGHVLLHYDRFNVSRERSDCIFTRSFLVPVYEPCSPTFFISVVSDRWLGCYSSVPISVMRMQTPDLFSTPNELLDLERTSIEDCFLNKQEFSSLIAAMLGYTELNAMQTQVYSVLSRESNRESLFISAPVASGKSLIATFCLAQNLHYQSPGKVLFLSPEAAKLKKMQRIWSVLFPHILIVILSGDCGVDSRLFKSADVVFATPLHWSAISHLVEPEFSLVVCDDLHLIGSSLGPQYESVITRLRITSSFANSVTRFVGLSHSASCATDIGEWIGASPNLIFNFAPASLHNRKTTILPTIGTGNVNSQVINLCRITSTQLGSSSAIIVLPNYELLQITMKELRVLLQNQRLYALEDDLTMLNGSFTLLATKNQLRSSEQNFLVDRVFVFGTEDYSPSEHGYSEYSCFDLLYAIKFARDECVVFTKASNIFNLSRLLIEPFPIESHLHLFLDDALVNEIANTKTICTKQDAVDWLGWSLLYRRIRRNPSYYGCSGSDSTQTSEYLSTLTDASLEGLRDHGYISLVGRSESEIHPLGLSYIAAHHCIPTDAMSVLISACNGQPVRSKRILELIAAAVDEKILSLRLGEASLLRSLNESSLLYQFPKEGAWLEDIHAKANILLQCHFCRVPLPAPLQNDLKLLLPYCMRLVQALVDVASNSGSAQPCIAAMEFCQFLTQAVWERDSQLLQLLHLSKSLPENASSIESIYEIVDAEDGVRENFLLSLSSEGQAHARQFLQSYPNVSLSYTTELGPDGQFVLLACKIVRGNVGESHTEPVPLVVAPKYPIQRDEGWWIVVAGGEKNSPIFALRKVSFSSSLSATLKFPVPPQLSARLLLISDCYVGCDQEFSISFE